MKKSLLLTTFSLVGLGALAQPTFQTSDFYPSIGETFTVHTSDYVSPGPSGSNVTWDLSAMTNNSSTVVNVLAPDPSYPTTTHHIEYVGQSDIHAELTSTEYLVVVEVSSTSSIVYSNPHKMYQFPMTMGDNFSDNFVGIVTQGTASLNRTGTVDVEVDGYGTLITPAGTYTNVLRIHNVKAIDDEYLGNTYQSSIDMYTWIQAGTHLELANIQTFESGGITGNTCTYTDVNTTGLADQYSENSLVLYPNPAQDIVTLKSNTKIDHIEVVDLNGRAIAVEFDLINKTIDVSKLNAGIYYVNVYSNNKKYVQKLIKR